jgi:hypothetical protein
MDKTRIRVVDLHGMETEWDSLTHMCAADRVGFERRFGISSAVMAKWGDAADEEGNLRPDADLSQIREEWPAYFVWAVCVRDQGETRSFDEWIVNMAEIEARQLATAIVLPPAVEDDPELDPTNPVARAGSLV